MSPLYWRGMPVIGAGGGWRARGLTLSGCCTMEKKSDLNGLRSSPGLASSTGALEIMR